MTFCPCHSQHLYEECCKPFHTGTPPQNALLLMRARYAAYALGLVDFIIQTTHPENPLFSADLASWRREIAGFSKNTQFNGLTILAWEEDLDTAFVTFSANLRQNHQDFVLSERSNFKKLDNLWLYYNFNILRK